VRTPSLTNLYFEAARTSSAWATFLGCSVAVHLGLVVFPFNHVPRHQNIAFAEGDAGVSVELVSGDMPTSDSVEEPVLLASADKSLPETALPLPVPVLTRDEAAFAEPLAKAAKAISPKSSPRALRSTPTDYDGSQASHAGSAAVQPAVQIITTQPPYPPGARESGVQGTVRLRVRVGADGCPREVKIARSSGRADFDNISLATVKREWHFRAARAAAGKPVESTIMVTIRFELNS
jgi:TonB family protein